MPATDGQHGGQGRADRRPPQGEDRPGNEKHTAVGSDFIVYGSLHGPDEGPRIAVVIDQIRQILGEVEPDPARPVDGVRVRQDSLRVIPRDSLPARLGCAEADNGQERPNTIALALRVRLS